MSLHQLKEQKEPLLSVSTKLPLVDCFGKCFRWPKHTFLWQKICVTMIWFIQLHINTSESYFHFIFNFVENLTFRTTLSKWLQLKYFSRRPQLEMHCKANSKRKDLPQKINRLASQGFTKSQQQTLMHSRIDSTLKSFES